MPIKKLTDAELDAALKELPGWKRQGKTLNRTFELSSFARCIEVVNAAAKRADEVDHHPDMIIQYRKLTFSLWTHDVDGVSDRDIALARDLDKLAS